MRIFNKILKFEKRNLTLKSSEFRPEKNASKKNFLVFFLSMNLVKRKFNKKTFSVIFTQFPVLKNRFLSLLDHLTVNYFLNILLFTHSRLLTSMKINLRQIISDVRRRKDWRIVWKARLFLCEFKIKCWGIGKVCENSIRIL